MVERLGALVIDNVTALGNFVLFLGTAVWLIVKPPYKPRLTIRQIRTIGAESVVLVALIGAFTGMVLGLQGYNTLRRFGSEGALGTVVALILVRELGPVMSALLRYASSIFPHTRRRRTRWYDSSTYPSLRSPVRCTSTG